MGGVSLSHRAEATPLQVAAVTGQPLLAPSPLVAHAHGQVPLPIQQSNMIQQYPGQVSQLNKPSGPLPSCVVMTKGYTK